MRPAAVALLSGTLFGAGLAVSQMTNPAKVIGFLDLTGAWDPSLAFVMGAALAVSAAGVQLARRANTSSVAAPGSGVDGRLLAGASIFGLGWGLAGFCPGPAIASLVTGSGQVLLFVCAMVAGMGLYRLFGEPASARGAQDPARHPV